MKWKGISAYDYKDRRIARMNALGNAIAFCQICNIKPTLEELLAIADKFLEYIYMDENLDEKELDELDEKSEKNEKNFEDIF